MISLNRYNLIIIKDVNDTFRMACICCGVSYINHCGGFCMIFRLNPQARFIVCAINRIAFTILYVSYVTFCCSTASVSALIDCPCVLVMRKFTRLHSMEEISMQQSQGLSTAIITGSFRSFGTKTFGEYERKILRKFKE